MKITILGSGSWGTALAQVLADNNHECYIWGINKNEIDDINNHRNSKFFKDTINPNIKGTLDINEVCDSDIIILAIPSNALEEICNLIKNLIKQDAIIVNVSKGFHPTTHERLSVFLKRNLVNNIVSIIGPSHGEEVIKRLLTTVNAVSDNDEAALLIQEVFSNDYFRVYTNNDVIGAEIGVALKNIMAIASGIITGLGQGDNAKAALMTRGLNEIVRYGTFFNGKRETFLGLCGVGDLIVTCTSFYSRNFNAGLEIGKANDAKIFNETNTKTVEGIKACKIVYEEAIKNNISMPITTEVYKVIFENKKPSDAVIDLMKRELKPEI